MIHFGHTAQFLRARKLFGLVVAGILALAVSGCMSFESKDQKPLSPEMKALLKQKRIKPGGKMYVRIFKQESQLEVWLQNTSNTYTKVTTYKICNWSGDLGPKTKQGDRQAPEGFYVVTPSQMNPNSKYHLSFNIGYPNAYDKSHGYTGAHLMVHGGCLSKGCYAITDEAVQELYALARESFIGGQREFLVHAFPFHMTAQNMKTRKGHKWYPFWKNLKEGHDLFLLTRRPPVAGTKNGRYVFFTGPEKVPAEYRVSAAASNPGAPRLIKGWN
ncbi:MAG: L,D-transpeptidase family protein [Hyphomicrobiales bacterium]